MYEKFPWLISNVQLVSADGRIAEGTRRVPCGLNPHGHRWVIDVEVCPT